jgi:glutathione S-transferase
VNSLSQAILYSYRRCPYAMRARMALRYAGIEVEIREITLRAKPQSMLLASPKGTVPVLITPNGEVLEQSLEIMEWALNQRDVDDWGLTSAPGLKSQAAALIAENDGVFKQALDRYKYADRYPEFPAVHYRAIGELFLNQLTTLLSQHQCLLRDTITQADIAIFPFVRQFRGVDEQWFDASHDERLINWLSKLKASQLFSDVMQKHPVWQET